MIKRKIKKCIICGNEFQAYGKQKCCPNRECLKKQNRKLYSEHLFTIKCKVCGNIFEGTKGQIKGAICPECKKSYIPKKEYKTYEQKELCPGCGKVMKINIKKLTHIPTFEIYKGECEECKAKRHLETSIRMKLNNPNIKSLKYNNLDEWENRPKKVKIPMTREEISKLTSERMKLNNPMHNPESIAKGKETYKKRIASGEIIIKRGADRWNWKGGYSDVKIALRRSLKQWRIDNLKRADYKCEVCGKSCDNLNIHHKEPFREILEKGLHELNLDITQLKYLDDNYMILEKWIQEYHDTHDIGMVLCPDCHDKVDECFHKQKNPRRDIYVEKDTKNR